MSLESRLESLKMRHASLESRIADEDQRPRPDSDTLLRLKGTKLHAEYLSRDGVRIELLHFDSQTARARPERVMNEPGLTHLSFRVSDLDAVVDALRKAGERVLDETIIRFPEWQSAACFIVDPDGQLIELVQAPGDPASPPRA